MIELVADGSFDEINLSIFDNKRPIYDLCINPNNTHSKILVNVFECAFKHLSLKLDDIDKFYCCIGPGKYTSLRVSLATIKGMLFDKADYVYGVTSLDLMAASTNINSGSFKIICQVSQTKTYFADFTAQNGIIKRKGEILSAKEQDIPLDEVSTIFNSKKLFTKNIYRIDEKLIKKIGLFELAPIY